MSKGKGMWFYRLVRDSSLVFHWLYNRVRFYGTKNVPEQGGCIIVSNHASFLDPPLIAAAVRHRTVKFLARDTLSANRVTEWIFRNLQTIALDRTKGDVGALRAAIKQLSSGSVIALFPEGTRSPDGQLHEAKGGVGFLVAKAKVPIIPAFVSGTYDAYPKGARFVRPAKITIRFGEPIGPDQLEKAVQAKDYREVGAILMRKIAELES